LRDNLFNNNSIPPSLSDILNIHTEFKLSGQPINALLHIPDKFLFYILSLLKNEFPSLPEASIDEWNKLFTLLIPHWILPLVYWKIGHLPKAFHPPTPIISRMRKAFMDSRVRCLQVEKQLLELLDAFNTAGIRVLVLKGPALARSMYPDPAMRPSDDIDLLVRPEEFIKARDILCEIGYQCEEKIFEVLKDCHCEEHFIPSTDLRNNHIIELHWDIQRFFGYKHDNKIEQLFFRATKVMTNTLCFETLHPIDALINAALHMIMTHCQGMRLIWIYDIALLTRNLEGLNDWELLQKRSLACGALLSVKNSLKMAQIWTGLQLPKAFNDFSTWPKPKKAEIVAMTNAIQRYERPAKLLKLYLSKPPSLFKKFHILFKLLFPNPNYMRNTYPSSCEWLLPFSYVRRLWRWW